MKQMNPILGKNIFTDYKLLGVFVIAIVLKIVGQIYSYYYLQIFSLILINLLLVTPLYNFLNFKNTKLIIYYLIILFFGQFFIMFYDNITLLKLGIGFYFVARIIMLLVFDTFRKPLTMGTFSDTLKIFLPLAISFALGYLFYNNSNLDLSLSILVILFAVADALMFTVILSLEKFSGRPYIIMGIVLLVIHDSFGGFNFFNKSIDPYFFISFLMISYGNYLFIKGLFSYFSFHS